MYKALLKNSPIFAIPGDSQDWGRLLSSAAKRLFVRGYVASEAAYGGHHHRRKAEGIPLQSMSKVLKKR